jgi:hypothetical protein
MVIREMVESLARMNLSQREKFLAKLVQTYPHLAESLHSQLGFELLDRDFRAELNAPYEEAEEPVEQEFDGTAYWGA